ncbi:MAG TPA: anti-anti-sigma factor [Chitinophagaceae bacterium]|nr:STAS domain-containing protein [Chitinophagia bacterium]HAL94464.1 anti-anti-sigma factor [Chitinophagaceae bacterium]
MRIKIDTKERFQVITLLEANLTARMAEELQEKLLTGLGNDKAPDGGFTHLVLSLSEVQTVEDAAASILVVLQNQFYEKGYSFVICCMQKEVENQFNKLELLELMNITPTESEAWDILQMEEIERELLNDSES